MKLKFIEKTIPFFMLIIGLLIFCYPMIFSHKMPGDLGDARFINYVLEHGWLFLNRVDIHSDFWTMPFFYPNQNTLAYSDIMLGGMILYIPIRFFTESPQTTLQIWFVLCCILNYISSYFLLKSAFKFNCLQSSLGAFLFAFGLPRYNQIGHLQLFTQFFMIFSILSFLKLDRQKSKQYNHLCFSCGSVFFVLQMYTSFYFGWFMVFGGLFFFIISFYIPFCKTKIYDFIKYYKKELILYSFLTCIMLCPLICHYLAVGTQFNWSTYRFLRFIGLFLSSSVIDNFCLPKNINVLAYCGENVVGIGLITTIFIIIGLLKKNKNSIQIFLFLTLIIVIFCNENLSHALYHYFPGASAIRAQGRIIFLLLPFYSYCIANFIKNINSKTISFIIVFFVIIEQIAYNNQYNWTTEEHTARLKNYNIPETCKTVYYDIKVPVEWKYLNDLIWVSSNKNIYLINGYSGYMPEINEALAEPDCRFIIKEPF